MRLHSALFAVAFAGATAASAVTPMKPACTLLTPQTASTLYGSAVRPKKAAVDSVGGTVGMCTYPGKGDDGVSLMVNVVPEHGDPNQMFEMSLKGDPRTKYEPASGVGERAVFLSMPDSPQTAAIQVLFHSTIFFLGADRTAGGAVSHAALIAAMKEVLSRM